MQKKIANPVQTFNYQIEIAGYTLANAVCQKVSIGEHEITVLEYGDGNKNRKFWGKAKVPDVVIDELIPTDLPKGFFTEKYRAAQNTSTGNTGLPSQVKFDATIRLIGANNATVRMWQLVDCWVSKMKDPDIGDMEDDVAIDQITLSVDDIIPLKY